MAHTTQPLLSQQVHLLHVFDLIYCFCIWLEEWVTWLLHPVFKHHLSIRFRSLYLYCNLWICLQCLSLILSRPLSHHHFCSLTSRLRVYFSADVLNDRVIALEADVWTQNDIARRYELMLKLGRISGIGPYMSHLVYRVEGDCVYRLNIGANALCLSKCVCTKRVSIAMPF